MGSEWLLAIGGALIAVGVIYVAGGNDRQWRRSRVWTPSDGEMLQGDVQWRGTTHDGFEILVLLRSDEDKPPSHVSGALGFRSPFEYQWVIAVGGQIWEERPAVAGISLNDQRAEVIARAVQINDERERRFLHDASRQAAGGQRRSRKRRKRAE